MHWVRGVHAWGVRVDIGKGGRACFSVLRFQHKGTATHHCPNQVSKRGCHGKLSELAVVAAALTKTAVGSSCGSGRQQYKPSAWHRMASS